MQDAKIEDINSRVSSLTNKYIKFLNLTLLFSKYLKLKW